MSHCAIVHTSRGKHPLLLRVADGFATRFSGLMFKPSMPAREGLLITRCTSVHTAFMRFAIDVVYLDACGSVTLCVSQLGPWRFSLAGMHARPRTRHTLELPAGSVGHWGIEPGDRLEADVFQHLR